MTALAKTKTIRRYAHAAAASAEAVSPVSRTPETLTIMASIQSCKQVIDSEENRTVRGARINLIKESSIE